MISSVVAAAVQAAPVFLDRDATVERACGLVHEAAARGAGLVVMPESYVPGYPDWVWRAPAWDDGDLYGLLVEQAVEASGQAAGRLAEAAADAGVWLAIGVTERVEHNSTLYNTLLYFSPEGRLAGLHRKLMATGGERTVWGQGDGSTLTAIDTPFGRIGGLICWEHYMPLARTAMWARGVDILLAPTWDSAEVWIATLRHNAKEGRVYVVGSNTCMMASDVPRHLPGRDRLYGAEDDWMSRGNAAIVAPDGALLAGPLIGEPGIVYAELDVTAARRSRREFDPVGHYARSDVFQLTVDDRPRPATSFLANRSGSAGATSPPLPNPAPPGREGDGPSRRSRENA